MAGKILNKLFGLEDEYDEIDEEENMQEDSDMQEENIDGKNKSKIVNIHTNATTKVVILKPNNFDDAADICDNFKNRKIVVVNTNNIEFKLAQRLIDFLGGASYVLGGSLQEIEKNIYILTPSNVVVNNELKNQLSEKGIFNFKI